VYRTKPTGQLLLFILLTSSCIGCQVFGNDIPGKNDVSVIGIEELRNRNVLKAMAGHLGVAPVAIAPVANPSLPADARTMKLSYDGIDPKQIVDVELLQTEIVKWANDTKLFKKCDALIKEEDQTIDDLAWAKGSDVILETTIIGIKPVFKNHHWTWFPNWVNLVMFTIPAWYVATEVYEFELEVELRLRLLDQTQAQLITTTKATVEGRFDEFARGFRWLGLGMVFSPFLNNSENWTAIAKKLFPAATAKVAQTMIPTLETEFRPISVDSPFKKANRRTLALVIGIGSYKDSNSFQANPQATKGADKVAAQLIKKFGRRYVRTLTDATATKKRIEEEIRGFLAVKARRADNVILFISTRLTMNSGIPVLVLHDSTPERGLAFGQLARIFKAVPGNLCLMLEADYPEAVRKESLANLFKPLTNKKISIMSATRPGRTQAATGFGTGLFSHHIAWAMRGKGDSNGDGQITFGEVGTYVSEKVQSDSGTRGRVQSPFVVIKGR
jgi:hypothetical protein